MRFLPFMSPPPPALLLAFLPTSFLSSQMSQPVSSRFLPFQNASFYLSPTCVLVPLVSIPITSFSPSQSPTTKPTLTPLISLLYTSYIPPLTPLARPSPPSLLVITAFFQSTIPFLFLLLLLLLPLSPFSFLHVPPLGPGG